MRQPAAGLAALLLTGGGDLARALFDEAPHATLFDVAPSRDTLETAVLHAARERGLRVLAVCRGLQGLNVALGGSLYQDVGTDPGTQILHSQTEPRDQPTHKVKVTPGSRLAETLGADELEVNSMHHQAIKRLGRGLTAVAWAPDQIVEGAELGDPARFVLGVQWHPEEQVGHSEPARRLFAALVASARKSRPPPPKDPGCSGDATGAVDVLDDDRRCPGADRDLVVRRGEAGLLERAAGIIESLGGMEGEVAQYSPWLEAAYLDAPSSEEATALSEEIRRELPGDWFTDTLVRRIASRVDDHELQARAESAIEARGRAMLTRVRALTGTGAALLVLAAVLALRLRSFRRDPRVADAPLPPPSRR